MSENLPISVVTREQWNEFRDELAGFAEEMAGIRQKWDMQRHRLRDEVVATKKRWQNVAIGCLAGGLLGMTTFAWYALERLEETELALSAVAVELSRTQEVLLETSVKVIDLSEVTQALEARDLQQRSPM